MNTSGQVVSNKLQRCAQLNQNLLINETKRKLKYSLYWGGCNSFLLGVLVYDILHTSPIHYDTILYLEYVLSIIFSFNLLYHVVRYIKLSKIVQNKPKLLDQVAPVTPQQEVIPYNFLSYSSKSQFQFDNTPTKSTPTTPMNTSAVSWLSNTSPLNLSGPKSPSSSFASPSSQNNTSTFNSFYESSGSEFIKDEQSLVEYLRGYENFEKSTKVSSQTEQPVNLMSSFWTHPSSKSPEVSYLLKNCSYQLSPPVTVSKSPSQYDRANNTLNRAGVDTWKHVNVSNTILTEWNANIRMWLSQTILERLCKKFDEIDSDLQKHGYTDIQIGYVGLEHLRKTSQMAPVLQYIPALSILIPFLEVSSNQEYLVKRIKELGKGGCMSNFKWNKGGTFNGKEWNDSLPTDSGIIMHLFATYMDIQLPPIPNRPDVKPFTDCHYVKFKQEIPTTTTVAIQQCSENPPQFCVLVGNEVFQIVQGYNNLFHTLLFFLYKVNEKEYGMLGGINLGKSGINILWVINR